MEPDFTEKMVWWTKDGRKYLLKDMTRVHVQNSMQMLRRNKEVFNKHHHNITALKDGYTFDEWMLAFMVRLLDPTCE